MIRAIALAAVCISISQPAEALVTATFRGKVTNLFNYTGQFGAVQRGDLFTFSFVYDPATNPAGINAQYYPYITHYGTGADNPVAGGVEINGNTYSADDSGGVAWGIYNGFADGNTQTFAMQARENLPNNLEFFIGASVYGRAIPNALNPLLPVTYTISDTDYATAIVNITDNNTQIPMQIDLRLLDYVTLNDGPVPEPATWAMMLGGFGLLGAVARRRRTQISFS